MSMADDYDAFDEDMEVECSHCGATVVFRNMMDHSCDDYIRSEFEDLSE